MYCFGSIISVILPARPCVTYQILTPWLAGTWKFPHPVFLRFAFIFKSVKLRRFVPIGFRLHNLTPKKQFPGTKDISGLRDAEKTVFSQNHLDMRYSQTLLNNTCIKIKDIKPPGVQGTLVTKTLDCP